MKLKSFVLLVAVLAFASHAAFADGWTFTNGRFPQGKATVFKLTKAQKAFLDLVRRCQKDNTKTPYLFELTREQSTVLWREAGFSPERFAIFESYRGDKGVDLEVNVINRFSEHEFEIPHNLLTRDKEAHKWEVSVMGWQRNPLLQANPALVKPGFCQTAGVAKAQQTRFFKAECGTAADYLQLLRDGTYRVLAREHAGVMQTERGNWQQNGSIIKFTPSSLLRGGKTVNVQRKPYEGTEEHYKGKTFITFKSEDSAEIAISSEDTKRELDHNSLPLYVFFETTGKVFASETVQAYPFRYIKPR
jgi:hypothetical protein